MCLRGDRQIPRGPSVRLRQGASRAPRARPLEQRSARGYASLMSDLDPVVSNPEHYRLLWENEHVRVLEYTDVPGDETTEQEHAGGVASDAALGPVGS